MLIPALLLSGLSLTVLHALSPELFYHQLWSVGLGFILFIAIRRTGQPTLQKLWWLWYVLTVLLLVITLSTPEVRGSHRWIVLFGISIQPSEIMKPFFILSLAGFVSLRKIYGVTQFLLYSAMFLVPFYFVLKQPDLGNSIVYLFVYFAILFISRFPIKYYLLPVVGLTVITPLIWPFLEEYQRVRIISFINPDYDIQGAGYNAYQALIAVGSGGIFGKGIGQGTQTALSFLPEYHTDFIFAATVEQIGMAGGLIILMLYVWLMIAMLNSLKEGNMFVRLVVWGTFAQIMIQTIVNIGMNTGILPITGITLPLLSFGGSSVLAVFISLGILSSFRREKKDIIAIH